jgi:hypothetical protein
VQNSKIQKIGQYPSLADLADSEIRKYRKVLGEDRYRELNRAVGLSAHGIGIGAYVYLRRIFESLIEDAHTVAAQTPDWDEETFQKSHMDEKIGLLADYLPQYLVENISIYSILSKGIHSLTEEECLDNFELLRVSIELILDQKIEQEERDKKISRTKNALDTLKGKLRSS